MHSAYLTLPLAPISISPLALAQLFSSLVMADLNPANSHSSAMSGETDYSSSSSSSDGSSSPYDVDWGNFLGRGPPPNTIYHPATSEDSDPGAELEEHSTDDDVDIDNPDIMDDQAVQDVIAGDIADNLDFPALDDTDEEEPPLDIAAGTMEDPIYIFSDPEEDSSSSASSSSSSSSVSTSASSSESSGAPPAKRQKHV